MIIQKCCQIQTIFWRPSPLREEGLATCVTTPNRTLVLGGWGSFSSMEIWAHVNAIYTTPATQKYYPNQRKTLFGSPVSLREEGLQVTKPKTQNWPTLSSRFTVPFLTCFSQYLFAQELKGRVVWGFQWSVGDYHLTYFVVTCVCIERVLFRKEFIQQLQGEWYVGDIFLVKG